MRFSIKDWFVATLLLSILLMVWKTDIPTITRGLRRTANWLDDFNLLNQKLSVPKTTLPSIPKTVQEEMSEPKTLPTVQEEMFDSFTRLKCFRCKGEPSVEYTSEYGKPICEKCYWYYYGG